MLQYLMFLVCDLETTGLDPVKDEIIEVAFIEYDDEGNRGNQFSALIHPSQKVPARITELTGIKQEDLAGEKSFEALSELICEWTEDKTPCFSQRPF